MTGPEAKLPLGGFGVAAHAPNTNERTSSVQGRPGGSSPQPDTPPLEVNQYGRMGSDGRFDYSRKVFNIYSRRRAGRVYPHEIDIQETHPKHRKLDSQAAIPHRARGRAADGLRPQAWPLRPSRCNHDPG